MVLVVDRDIGSCLILRKMIASLGFQCDIVHSIDDSVRTAAAKEYSLIMVGCLMDDKDCWVLSHAMKLLPRKGPSPVVVAVLSCSDPAMMRRCAEEGLNRVLTKPVSKAEVSECIKLATHGRCSDQQILRTTENQPCRSSRSIHDYDSVDVCGNLQNRKLTLSVLQQMPSACQNMDNNFSQFGELNSSLCRDTVYD